MATAEIAVSPAAEIRELTNRWLEAVRANDLDRIMRHYAPGVVAFDAIARLQFKGAEAYRQHWQACFEMCPPGSMIMEHHDVEVVAEGDLAYYRCLVRCGVRLESGEEKASWMRATVCFRRMHGTWQVVHEHWSAPFDPHSGKVLFDAQP